MNFTPQVETREISDADLDNVSGGLVGGLVNTAEGVTGLNTAPVTGTVAGVVGTVEGITGLNTAPVTGIVVGL